jgi:hypothetical protein
MLYSLDTDTIVKHSTKKKNIYIYIQSDPFKQEPNVKNAILLLFVINELSFLPYDIGWFF